MTSGLLISYPNLSTTAVLAYPLVPAINMLRFSEQFDNTAFWQLTGAGISVTADNTTAPDGTVSAELLSHTASDHVYQTPITLLNATNYTYSLHAKPNASSWIRMTVGDSIGAANGVLVWFNVTTGVTGTLSFQGSGWTPVSSSIVPAANGFFRCIVTLTSGGTTGWVFMRCANADNTGAVSGNSSWFWGAQLEIGSQASGYTKTL